LGRGVAEGAFDKRRVLAVEAQIGKRSLAGRPPIQATSPSSTFLAPKRADSIFELMRSGA